MTMRIRRGLASGALILVVLGPACGGSEKAEAPTAPANVNVATAAANGTATAAPASPAATQGVSVTVAASTATGTTSPATPTTVATSAATKAANTPVPQPTPVPRASAVALSFRAANLAFDKTSVHVPAGATVTATMQNDDPGIEHNLTFSLPGLAHGETCKGPCTATQTFNAGGAGSYFFLCTIHDMVGNFVVDP